MKAADAHPETNRDMLKDHNNMWSYPKTLDPDLSPKQEVFGDGATKDTK